MASDLTVKVYINDQCPVPVKYSVSSSSIVLDIKELISVDTGVESKYQTLRLYGVGEHLKNNVSLSSISHGVSGVLLLSYSSSKAMEENRKMADEYYPELGFGIQMLSMNIVVNGSSLSALLDTGAQITIIKLSTVKRLGLENLIDKSYSKILAGVGTGRTEGKIHLYNISINGTQYPVSMDVLDTDTIREDMIFGLDNMVRLRAVIDIYNRTITLNNENVIKLDLIKRPTISKNIIDEDPALLQQAAVELGMSPQELTTVFNDVCGGDVSKFEKLFLSP